MSAERRTPVIGLTGGIGAGKSAVARILADLGGVVSDSDRDTGEILRMPDVIETMRGWWGDGVVDDEGMIDRREIARRVFNDASARRRLEELVHPLVHDRRRARFSESPADTRMFVIDAPLLFEAGLDSECDTIWFVDAPLEVRRERVRVHRGWSEEELDRREASQWPIEKKRRRSDVVLDNGAALETLETQVRDALTAMTYNGS